MSRAAQFRRLYALHFRAVWSVVGQLGMHGAAREDAVQEVWIVAYRRLHTLDPDASARAWLCSIARKVVWRIRRSVQRSDRRVMAFADEPRTAPSDASARYEAASTVEEALGSLSEAQRNVLVLTSVHGFSAPEIADALSIPLNTVYSRLRLARRRIAEHALQRAEVQAALEAGDRAPAGTRARVLCAVLPTAPLVPAAASTIKAFALGGIVGGFAVAATVAVAEPPPVVAPVQPRVSSPAVVEASARPAEAPHPAPVDPVPTPAVSVDRPAPAPRPSSRSVPAAVASPEPSPPPQPPSPSLDLEAELLARAQRAIKGKRPAQALRLLRQHELQFADGRLADVREGAFVRALCAQGRESEAATRVRRMSAQRPGSAVTTAVEDVCSNGDGSNAGRR